MSKVLPLPGKPAPPAGSPGLNSIEEMVADLKAGRMVIVVDDEDRENEGDLIMAAQLATPEAVAFMIRHASGIICVPMEEERLARLDLPQMVASNSEAHRTAFTISVDLRAGTTTGVSSSDRAATIRALADERSEPRDFARPGHIFPLRSRRGGVLVRTGHTEAAVDLCRLAGLGPAGVICEVMNDDGTMARRPQLEAFARQHGLKIGTIADLIRYRLRQRALRRAREGATRADRARRVHAVCLRGPRQPGRASGAGPRGAARRGVSSRARARGGPTARSPWHPRRPLGVDSAGGHGADRPRRQRRHRDPARPRVAGRSAGVGALAGERRVPGMLSRTRAPARTRGGATAKCCGPLALARRSSRISACGGCVSCRHRSRYTASPLLAWRLKATSERTFERTTSAGGRDRGARPEGRHRRGAIQRFHRREPSQGRDGGLAGAWRSRRGPADRAGAGRIRAARGRAQAGAVGTL